MSLNKTLDRLFDEIRREARRNPDFADRLDAILRVHESRRDVPEDVVAEARADAAEPPPPEPIAAPAPSKPVRPPPVRPRASPPEFNPVGLLQREGEDALEEALVGRNREALLALIAEHNLDPAGEVSKLDRDALQEHVVAQAKRRIERDKKLFEY